MIKIIAIAMSFGSFFPWNSKGFPFVPNDIQKWDNLREKVIAAQGKNVSILDIGCGVGFSTSSSPGSLGIEPNLYLFRKAKKLFPNKKFQIGDVLFWNSEKKYDVVTTMFFLHEHPRHIRKNLIEKAKSCATERIIIVDFCPDYEVDSEMNKRKPFLKDFLIHCHDELDEYTENVLLKGRVHMWTLDMKSKECVSLDENDDDILMLVRYDKNL